MDKASLVGRDVEQELGVAPDRRVVDVEEAVERLDLVVFGLMVEPARPDGHVDLARIPDQAAAFSGHFGDPLARSEIPGPGLEPGDPARAFFVGQVVHPRDGDDAPLALAGDARFVSDPAGVRADDGDDRARLELADEGVVALPVVDLPLAVGALGAGPVEPDLGDLAVTRQELAELVAEMLVVARRVAVARLVAVPRRQIKAELEAGLAAGLGDLADDVPLAAPPGRALDRMLREPARPEAEAVVVLGRQDEPAHAGGLEGPDPLAGVEGGRIEERRVLFPCPPLAVGEGVDAEMDEGLELEGLPGELALRRPDPDGLGHQGIRRVPGREDRLVRRPGARTKEGYEAQDKSQAPEAGAERAATARRRGVLGHRDLLQSVSIAHCSPLRALR